MQSALFKNGIGLEVLEFSIQKYSSAESFQTQSYLSILSFLREIFVECWTWELKVQLTRFKLRNNFISGMLYWESFKLLASYQWSLAKHVHTNS